MGSNFLNLKKRTKLASAIISAALGIGIGAILLAGVILALKLLGKPIEILHYLIGFAGALLSTAIFILILLPSDRKLAKRLDNEHSLEERVSTMVEFRDSSDPFVKLQRDDTDQVLSGINYTPWRRRPVTAMIAILLCAAIFLTVALVIPGFDFTEPESPIDQHRKEFILAELSGIISNVEKSLIEDSLKESSLEQLRGLVTFVEGHEYESQMKLEAIKVILAINKSLLIDTTATVVGKRLSECTQDNLKALGEEFIKINGPASQKAYNALKDTLEKMDRDEVTFIADELSAAVLASEIDTQSPLGALLTGLTASIRGYSAGNIDSVSAVFGTTGGELLKEVMTQSINTSETSKRIYIPLKNLFGITDSELASSGGDDNAITPPATSDSAAGSEDDTPWEEPSDQIGSGGIGSGDRVYGSNDMIYNPYTNQYVPYGQVLDEYNNKVITMIRDGLIPPDFEEFTNQYFLNLSSFTPEEEDTEN